MPHRVLIVGGNGFVGRFACKTMAAQGRDVYGTFRSGSVPPTARGVAWVPCDLTDSDITTRWPAKVDSVIYLAQARAWRLFPGGAADVMRVNVNATMEAVAYALRAGAKRFIFASTGSVYSRTDCVATESDLIDLDAPRNFYSASKLAAESLLRPYKQLLPVIVLRLYAPYGAGQSADYLFPKLVQSVVEGKPITLTGGDGIQTNPVAVGDVAHVLDACLKLEHSTTLNVAGPEILTLRAIGETIGSVVGCPPVFELRPEQPAAIVAGDTTRLQETLGWTPATRLHAGLSSYLMPMLVKKSA